MPPLRGIAQRGWQGATMLAGLYEVKDCAGDRFRGFLTGSEWNYGASYNGGGSRRRAWEHEPQVVLSLDDDFALFPL